MAQRACDRVLVAAGGTGGHLFPAEALARGLNARGIAVELATDDRADALQRRVSGAPMHVDPERDDPRPRSVLAGEDRDDARLGVAKALR